MDLLIAGHDLYPDPASGGTGRYIYEVARRLAERGHGVTVVTRLRGDVPPRGTVAGFDVFRFELSLAGRPGPLVLAEVPAAYRTVAEHIASLDPDLVSFQGQVESLLLDRTVDDAIPRSCTFHSPWPTEYLIHTRGRRSRWRRRLNATLRGYLEGKLLERTDDVITLSEFMCERLLARYEPDARSAVVPGGVDVERFTPDAGEYEPMAGDDVAILAVRRLSPRMGHDLLLAAFSRMADRHPTAELYIAGEGELRGRLETLAAELDIADRTTFLGYVPDEDLPAAFASADVSVVPTRELEGFGLATLEALASGTPVVGTPVGGTVELLGGCQAQPEVPEQMLSSSVDARALADRLSAWTTLSPDELEAAGRACRRYARKAYPWESTVDALEERYTAIARGRG